MEINAKKTKIMAFSKNDHVQSEIKINGVLLPQIATKNPPHSKSADFDVILVIRLYYDRHTASDKLKLSLMRALQRPKDKAFTLTLNFPNN